MVKLGEYAVNNGTGPQTNPVGDKTIELNDDISNYRFLYVASAFYTTVTAVFGSICIPTAIFLNSNEYICYPVKFGDEPSPKWDTIGRNGNSNYYINLHCGSTYPMSIWGVKCLISFNKLLKLKQQHMRHLSK